MVQASKKCPINFSLSLVSNHDKLKFIGHFLLILSTDSILSHKTYGANFTRNRQGNLRQRFSKECENSKPETRFSKVIQRSDERR
jgi:hypothetical protein